ncbi:hypothetical protein I6A60_34055 [Frankia sp. AgB1.9]|uniref:effector-associated domain EAD1-containing protein n=1 Tax=unclassified Frankia TaxID=2632575 RepID=UPI001932C3D6|nr:MULTISPECIES: effector-associated domain EAD1-containing protein [unclassified Frankia]MBL7488131.1 hypothetical protein [Frankia sp. AgW1.1]MBL7552843.1 hypothetical protein [Frankia sp. AgB1.9]MBL7620134.1 hypothetical protein [Frankia sp. AgB1.8]
MSDGGLTGAGDDEPPWQHARERLPDQLVSLLARLFPTPVEARQVLERAGWTVDRQPSWQASSALEFWREASRLLHDGAVPDGNAGVIRAALEERPDNPSLRAAVAAANAGDGSPVAGSDDRGLAAGWSTPAVARAIDAIATDGGARTAAGSISIGHLTVYQAGGAADRWSLDGQADLLASAIHTQVQRAAIERRLVGSALLPIRWRRSALPVAGPVSAATANHDRGIRFEPLPGLHPVSPTELQRGDRADLHAIYGGLASGRLVILGPGGAGKSSAAVLLQLDALHHREQLGAADRARVPVPVLVTPHGWNPKTTSVRDWIAERLTESAPFRRRRGLRRARSILDAGRVAVILDGLDEVNESLRALMLKALSDQVTFRLVLLTRSAELVTAVEGALLDGAAAIELRPLTTTDVVDHLQGHLVDPAPPRWRAVIDEVARHPAAPLGQTLANPLNVTLLRDVYPSGGPVDELLDKSRFGTPDDIEAHLLDHVVPAAYAPRLGFSPPRYSTRRADRTLRWFAYQLTLRQSREFGWWNFFRWACGSWTGQLLNLAIGMVALAPPALAATIPVIGIRAAVEFFPLFSLSIAMSGGSLHGGPVRLGAAWRRDLFTGRPLAPDLAEHTRVVPVFAAAMGVLFGGYLWWFIGLHKALLAAGLTSFFVFVIPSLFLLVNTPNTGETSWSDPGRTRQQDIRAALAMGLLMALLAGAITGIVKGPKTAVEVALIVGPAAGLVATETWASVLSQINLGIRHRTPVRMVRFLEDARGRHVLRTVGPAYQFRHLKLQDHLVGQYLAERYVTPATDHVALVAQRRFLQLRRRPPGLDATARYLLCIGALLDPAGVPGEVFGRASVWASSAEWHITDAIGRPDPNVAATAQRQLFRAALVSMVPGSSALAGVNSVVQRALRDRLSDADRAALTRSAADALLETWPKPGDADRSRVWRANAAALSQHSGTALRQPTAHPVLLRAGLVSAADLVSYAEPVRRSLSIAALACAPGETLQTGPVLAALSGADGTPWDRVWLAAGWPDLASLMNSPDSPGGPEFAEETWDGTVMSSDLVKSLHVLAHIAHVYDLTPAPVGAFAVALLFNIQAGATRCLLRNSDITHEELLARVGQDLLGVELTGVVEIVNPLLG